MNDGQQPGDPTCSACGETCHWNEDSDHNPDPLCNPCAQQIASDVRKASRDRTPEEIAAKAVVRDAARARKAHDEDAREYRESPPWQAEVAARSVLGISEPTPRELTGLLDRFGPKAETEAERQVRRCAEALGYVGEPDRLAVVVGDACLAFAKDLREINARYMARISKLEESLAVEVESLSAEVARLTDEVAATRAEAKRQIDAAIDRSQEAEKALTVVGWPGGDPIKWAHKVCEDATPSSLTVAMYEAVASDLGRQLLRKCASNNDLVEEIGRKDQAMRDLSRQSMEYSQLVDRYKMAMVKLGSATEIAAALEWASPLTPSAAPQVRCKGYVTVRINKDRVIVKGQTWTSDDPNFKAWDVSLHDDDPRFGLGAPQQRSHVGPTMELGDRKGTWTWRGSMGGFGDLKWQGAWTAEPTQAASTEIERIDYSRFPPGYSGETTTVDAWSEWKAKNDPPGFTIYRNGPTWLWALDVADGAVGEAFEGTKEGEEDARRHAWKWYDRRRALAHVVMNQRDLSLLNMIRLAWPHCLAWSDEQVDEVERWLFNWLDDSTAEMPEVLRG